MRIDSTKYYREMLANPEDFERLIFYKNVNEMLVDCCSRFGDQKCIQYLEGDKTFNQLNSDSNHIAKVLRDSGVKKGDTVGLLFRNEYDFVASFFACSKLGAIAALLPLSLAPEVVERLSYLFKYKTILFKV